MIENKGIGLVLAGGGAKGAFQVGALRALTEFGILNNITAISGASAGGLNCAMLLQNDNLEDSVYFMDKVWRNFTLKDFVGDWRRVIQNAIELRIMPMLFIKKGILSQCNLQNIINENISMHKLFTHRIDCYITCYRNLNFKTIHEAINFSDMVNIVKNPSEPLFINSGEREWQYTPSQIKSILLATAAIPVLFDSVPAIGNKYNDGGTEALFNRKKLVDGMSNVPYNVLLEKGYKNIIIIHFDSSIDFKGKIQRKFSDVNVIEITPDRKVIPMVDTCNFSEENIFEWIKEGISAARRIVNKSNLEPYQQAFSESSSKKFVWGKSTVMDDLEYLLFEMRRGKKEEIILKDKDDIAVLFKKINSFKTVGEMIFSSVTNDMPIQTAISIFNMLKNKYELFEYNKTDLRYINNDNIYFYLKN